jgi:hypothetical protein
MNADRFDTITRGYERGSRRQALRLVGSTALGATLLSLAGANAASKECRQIGMACCTKKGKDKTRTCCFGACRDGRCKCIHGGIPSRNTSLEIPPCPSTEPIYCGPYCCKPGQLCQGESVCTNGDLQPGDLCNPDEPFTCQTGNCQCINHQCTCRQKACLD